VKWLGGVNMASEAVQAVRQAEGNAEQIEKEALKKKEIILQNANEEASSIVDNMMKEELMKAEAALEQAWIQGDVLMAEAIKRAEREADLLKERIKTKDQAAVQLVLSEII
jgi:vacuolar-type H+-ATPase subunit H